MSNRAIGLLIAAAVAIFLLTQTFYTVDPTKQVLVRQFGALVGAPKTEPGLYMKIPLVQDIVRIDRRLLDYEADEFEIIAGDQKRLVVDAYARFKIVNARQFAETVPGGEPALRGILDSLINSEIRGVLSGVPLHAVLTDQRGKLMDEITKRVNAKTKDLGVEVVDVRIKRADLPQANSQSVYNRMKTDREREAGQLRAEGDEEKARITATADREVSVIKADAGVDTGEVLVEQTFPIDPDDSIARLHEIANDAFPRMMLQAVRDIRDGHGRGRVQNRAASRYWPLRFPDDGAILFDRLTAREIHNRIRALTVPYPCAFTAFNGRKVNLLRSALAQSDIRGEPGRIYRISDGRLLVGAADCCLWLAEAVFADTEEPLAAVARRYDRLATVSEAAMRILLNGES